MLFVRTEVVPRITSVNPKGTARTLQTQLMVEARFIAAAEAWSCISTVFRASFLRFTRVANLDANTNRRHNSPLLHPPCLRFWEGAAPTKLSTAVPREPAGGKQAHLPTKHG